ncbi:unnamed protein product, partial [Heterotrigona itama]
NCLILIQIIFRFFLSPLKIGKKYWLKFIRINTQSNFVSVKNILNICVKT